MAVIQNLIATFVSLVITVTFLLILEAILESANEKVIRKRIVIDNNYLVNTWCSGSVVILVTSYEGHIELRSAIRRTKTELQLKEMGVRRVFLIGQSHDKGAVAQAALLDEANKFGYIIQGDFWDTYRNLTTKNLMGLRWVGESCPNAKVIIKIDDDIVIDLPKILSRIPNSTNILMGYRYQNMIPKRDPTNKWYVTLEEYPGSTYPPYLSGWFYITTPDVAHHLVETSRKIPSFWVEDIYITGMLVQKSGIQVVDIKDWFTADAAYLNCCINDVIKYGYDCDILVGPNGGDNKLIWKFNQMMEKCRNGGCKSRPPGKGTKDTCVAEYKEHLSDKGSVMIDDFRLS